MTEDQIKHMVSRFLTWRLPEGFNPDGGISFEKTFNEHTAFPRKHEPVGTNLFDATQATAMVRHMVDGLPAETPNSAEMPCYQCHKKVSALKIASVILSAAGIVTKIIAIGHSRPLAVPKDWHKRYAGTDDDKGYFVLYDGGYASWSPSKEFEDGYTLIE
ncbi:hypothetical protein NKI48_02975 [Mesorhizobium sp. M0644]|uniref:hypothetical protein n=1 Tax=Mesorhizobium sp. M0644 TaxID=2956979 RepID=UPI0033363891